MKKRDIIAYLEVVAQQEKAVQMNESIYLKYCYDLTELERSAKNLENTIKNLEISKIYILNNYRKRTHNSSKSDYSGLLKNLLEFFTMSIVIIAVILLISTLFNSSFAKLILDVEFLIDLLIVVFLVSCLISSVITIIIHQCHNAKIYSNDFKAEKNSNTEYREEDNIRKKTDEIDNQILTVQQSLENVSLQISEIYALISKAEVSLNKSREVLRNLYSENIIQPKYQSLLPVVMFLDFFSTGKCSGFTGSDGAYALYEREKKLKEQEFNVDNIFNVFNDLKRC